MLMILLFLIYILLLVVKIWMGNALQVILLTFACEHWLIYVSHLPWTRTMEAAWKFQNLEKNNILDCKSNWDDLERGSNKSIVSRNH